MSKNHPKIAGTPAALRLVIVGTGKCNIPGCDCADEHSPADAFAYTIGLHRRGMAELRLSAQPAACSEMPVLPGYELGRVLRAIADEYARGRCRPGEVAASHGWPGGFAVNLRLEDELIDRDLVECWQTDEGAAVRPVTWCAHREELPTA